MISKQQKRVIIENPNIHSGKIAKLIGCHIATVQRVRNSNWSYAGIGIPFLSFDGRFRVKYQHKSIFSSSRLAKAIKSVDHLIWCIDSGLLCAVPSGGAEL